MTPFFEKLWIDYQSITPTAERVKNTLRLDDYEFFNDHVAFRSVNQKGFGIDQLIQPFLREGYKKCDSYYFEEKKLNAIHLESTINDLLPKVFISEIILEEFSELLQNTIKESLCSVKINDRAVASNILHHGRSWKYNHATYLKLAKESEYAAWIYAHGYRVNHFTIRVNSLDNLSIEDLCQQLLNDNIALNESGGQIKGSENVGLKQSSTLADHVNITCSVTNKTYTVPSCYVEFAERFALNGKQFNGFITKSANHIFDSTNLKKSK